MVTNFGFGYSEKRAPKISQEIVYSLCDIWRRNLSAQDVDGDQVDSCRGSVRLSKLDIIIALHDVTKLLFGSQCVEEWFTKHVAKEADRCGVL